MRMKISEEPQEGQTLDELISLYAMNKRELDSYKKICDTENAQIKDQMYELGIDSYSTKDGYTAKYIVSEKASFNEDKLLAVVKKHGITDVVKTREYVDMDALENYLYHLDEEDIAVKPVFEDIDSCRDVKQIVSLRVSKK